MHSKLRLISIAFAAIFLSGCFVQQEPSNNDVALADDTQDTTADLNNDILIAPSAPALTIAAAPGALQFTWIDQDTTEPDQVSEVNLYQYDSTTQEELLLDSPVDVEKTSYVLPISPHQLAWQSTSFRVELCTATNCLSSERKPINDLLINAVSGFTANNAQLGVSFGDDIAINAEGNVAFVTSPLNGSVLVFFHISDRWIQASTLTSQNFSNNGLTSLRVSASASGETLAVASLSERAAPRIVIFELLGENWIETATINAFNNNSATQSWDIGSLRIKLSNNGSRLVFGAQEANPSVNSLNNQYNRLWVYDLGDVSWIRSAMLSVAAQHVRLPSFAGSSDLSQVFALSALNGALYVNEFNIASGNWQLAAQQYQSVLIPTIDTMLVTSARGDQIALAGWENQRDGQRAAVAWRFIKTSAAWVSVDSVKLAPTANRIAQIRLAADANLNSIAIGWQASADANLAFYKDQQTRWQHQFSVPNAFGLTRRIGLAQSVVISADNTTALIGTSNTGNGGLVTAFK